MDRGPHVASELLGEFADASVWDVVWVTSGDTGVSVEIEFFWKGVGS